jgi:hypothetical protein
VYPSDERLHIHREGSFFVLSIRRALVVLSFLISASGVVLAQFPMPTQRPQEDTQPAQMRELVSKYCRLDYDGGRLDPKMWPKFQPLVWWTSPQPYTKIDVIARYTVDPEPSQDHAKFTVTVHYRLLGAFDPAFGYIREPEGTVQDVYYSATPRNTEWRISDSDNLLPHPSRAAMLKWLAEQINTTQDETMKARYQNALEHLQGQSGSPFAR